MSGINPVELTVAFVETIAFAMPNLVEPGAVGFMLLLSLPAPCPPESTPEFPLIDAFNDVDGAGWL